MQQLIEKKYRYQTGKCSLRWASAPRKCEPCFHGNPVPRMVYGTFVDTRQLFVDQMMIK